MSMGIDISIGHMRRALPLALLGGWVFSGVALGQAAPPEAPPNASLRSSTSETQRGDLRPRRRVRQERAARHRLRQQSLISTLEAFNRQARNPLPQLQPQQLQRLTAGEPVRMRHKQPEPGVPQRAIALQWVELPRDDLWVAIQDPHFAGLGNTLELRLTAEGEKPTMWFGFLDLPWPLKDRQWVVEVWDHLPGEGDPDLDAWEHGWHLARQGWPLAQRAIRQGKVEGLSVERSSKAILTPLNHGAWVMIAMDDASTLLAFHASFEIGGSVPDRLVVSNTLRSLERLLEGVVERAKTRVPKHYVGDHTVLLGVDGQPIPPRPTP